MRKTAILFACVLTMAAMTAAPALASQAEIDRAIHAYFEPGEWATAKAVVACESGYGADIYNEASAAGGPWQFLPSTAYGMGYDYERMFYDFDYATWAAADLQDRAGWGQWACATGY